jgi:hypothetical protein
MNLTKISITIVVFSIFIFIMNATQEVVIVKNGKVVEVNGKSVYRDLTKTDKLEAKIIYK